jgi:hypothetical protein
MSRFAGKFVSPIPFLILLVFPVYARAGLNAAEAEVLEKHLYHMNIVAQEEGLSPSRDLAGNPESQGQLNALKEIMAEVRAYNLKACESADLAKDGVSSMVVEDKNSSKTRNPGRAIVRAAVRIPRDRPIDVKSVTDIVTSEIRSPIHKFLRIKGSPIPDIARHYWYTQGTEAVNVPGKDYPPPLPSEGNMDVKKCLKGEGRTLFGRGWGCNNQRYRVIKLSESATAVVSVQLNENRFPGGFKDGEGKTQNFDKTQIANSFDGFTGVTIIRDTGHEIEIYDTNHIYTEAPGKTGSIKTAQEKGLFKLLMGKDLSVLQRRIPTATIGCGGPAALQATAGSGGDSGGDRAGSGSPPATAGATGAK